MAAQVAHASLGAFLHSNKKIAKKWQQQGQKKIVVQSNDLQNLQMQAHDLDIANFLVSDAGLTELEPGTITALGLGPDDESIIDKISKGLLLL